MVVFLPVLNYVGEQGRPTMRLGRTRACVCVENGLKSFCAEEDKGTDDGVGKVKRSGKKLQWI